MEEAEVSAFLPTAETQFRDLAFQMHGTGTTLGLLCSLGARHAEDTNQAETYAKRELMSNLNPIKQLRAHMAFAISQCQQKEEQEV